MKCKVVAEITLTLLLIGTFTLTFDIQPVEAEQSSQLLLYTDKDTYILGENITITVENVGNETVNWTGVCPVPWDIYTYSDGKPVFEAVPCYCLFELHPSENITYAWNQSNQYTLTHVEPGMYVVRDNQGWGLSTYFKISAEIIVPDDYPTIQEAINAAEEGDAIFVRNESYYENVVVNKTVTLIGENRETTIINGSRVGNVLCVVANNVTVSNFKIIGGGSGFRDCGIYVNSSNNAFFNNIITDNNWGIYFDRAHSNTVSSNAISNQVIGHYMERSDNNTFKRNILTNNDIGFYSTYSDYNVFDENMIVGNEGEGILVLHGDFCTFKRNTLINNPVAFWLEPVCNCLITNNSVANSREVGVRFHGYSYDNVIVGNNITGNKDGLFFHDTSQTTILHNTISKNENGIAIYGGSSINVRLEIKYNSIINNTIGLWNSEYLQPNCAKVSQNNFINNNVQAKNEMQSILQWNAEYPSGGNYWSDYDGADVKKGLNQDQPGSDGIGDTLYTIDSKNTDYYPLTKPYGGFHDIGITKVTTSKTVIGQNYSLTINVKIRNYRAHASVFNVTAYANTTTITTLTNITLTGQNSTTLTFTWNTTGIPLGNYIISAYATPVPNETYTTDNELIGGWITIAIPGDINADGTVNILDMATVAKAYNSRTGDPNWNPNVDLDDNSTIDIFDIAKVAREYGKNA